MAEQNFKIYKRPLFIVVFIVIIIIIAIFYIYQNSKEYEIATYGEPGLLGKPEEGSLGANLLSGKYYATKIISYNEKSIRFIEKGTNEEKFIDAVRIEVKRIK
ncbi:MAG: hypothetical protein H8E13_00510 [Actinobacteria bacterium]|nr:hypothetical protein [Actinomycetota bacterium]